MRFEHNWLAALACGVMVATATAAVAAADEPKDVPANHWARPAVLSVTEAGTMTLQAGKFRGDAAITRIELAQALERWVRAIEDGKWKTATSVPTKAPKKSDWRKAKVTRYELAAALDRLGAYAAKALKKGGPYGASYALGPKADVSQINPKSPAYDALRYLADNRMVAKGSILLKPTNSPVTGEELSSCLTVAIAGLCDRLTDEPQDREEIPHPAKKG